MPAKVEVHPDRQWIADGLELPGKSKSGLAKAFRRSPSMVTLLLKGGRELKERDVTTIVNYLGVQPPSRPALSRGEPAIDVVMIKGEVAGGVWTEPSLEFEPVPTTVVRDPQYEPGALYCLRVRGNSINRQARDGDLVLCLDIFKAPRRHYREGDWVIVERKRAGLVERTVKKVAHAYNGEWMLLPDSDDKAFQDPIPVVDDEREDTEVVVRAFVLDFIRQGTRF